jgi:acylpyruvate hydrolase
VRLATLRTGGGTTAVRIDEHAVTDLGVPDVGTLLADPGWRERAADAGPALSPGSLNPGSLNPGSLNPGSLDLATLVPRPGKVICVGLNYRTHLLEMGRALPRYPALFAKFAEALIGPRDPIALPPESAAVDWEAELAVVIGGTVRRADPGQAAAAIAGFTVLNDITMRDWQYRSPMWLQGKTFEGTTPVGPVLVTPDELPGGVRPALELHCEVDGETMQKASTGDLVFDPVDLVRYVSTVVTLRPGDLIATGTPGGVGHARKPPRYLADGSVVVTEISGLGRCENQVRRG